MTANNRVNYQVCKIFELQLWSSQSTRGDKLTVTSWLAPAVCILLKTSHDHQLLTEFVVLTGTKARRSVAI